MCLCRKEENLVVKKLDERMKERKFTQFTLMLTILKGKKNFNNNTYDVQTKNTDLFWICKSMSLLWK